MDRHQERIWMVLSLLAFLTDPGLGYSIIEGPTNLTILTGLVAHFNCTVSEGWQILIWLQKPYGTDNAQPKLSVLHSGDTIITDNRYNQQSYKSGTNFTSELMIKGVQMNDSGQIMCSLQQDNDYASAFLSVQVNGSLSIKDSILTVKKNQTIEIVCEALGWAPAPNIAWMVNNVSVDNSEYITGQSQGSNGLYNEESILTLTPVTNDVVTCLAAIDALSKPQYATVTISVYEPSPTESDKNEDSWRTVTIILAVVLSVIGLLLLILIILLIICCCKRRKESNFKKKMRKVSEKKVTDRNIETISHGEKENYGYSPEESKSARQMTRGSASAPVHLSIYDPKQDIQVHSSSEVPYDGHHDNVLPPRTTAYPISPRKIRNLTLV